MSRNHAGARTQCVAVLTVLFATMNGHAIAAPVTLWNGVTGDGSLTVTVDDFGSFADAFAGGQAMLDFFDPSADPIEGELLEEFATFATEVFLFVDPSGIGNGTHRAVLSSHAGILSTYPNGNIDCVILRENSTDNLPTSTDSEFRCVGSGIDLTFTLTQTVSTSPDGPNSATTASLEQTYAVTSEALPVVEFILVKHIDADMPWGGGATFYLDDTVGADFAELDRPQVYAVDRNLNTAAMTLRTREDMWLDARTTDFVYYPGKQNLPPPPGNPNYPDSSCPPHDYGTDFQIWDSYGVPNCWKNFIPGVGYNVPGQSPVDAEGDSFIGLQVEAALPPGETYEVTFVTSYGARLIVDGFIPPVLSTQTIAYDQVTGCAEFLWELTNRNPIVTGKDPVQITEFYIDVEAGDGGNTCATITPPAGWSVTLCDGIDTNGHALYKFFGGTPISIGDKISGRLEIDTNGLSPHTNQQTNITVPPLSVVLHAAQNQTDATCDFNFGPSNTGDWGLRTIATTFLPVPASATWAKAVLALSVTLASTLLIFNARRSAERPGRTRLNLGR